MVKSSAKARQSRLRQEAHISLLRGELHVWRIQLKARDTSIAELWETLKDDERRKALSFTFDNDRSRYIVGRGSLRRILSAYLLQEPSAIHISYNRYGKPFVSYPSHSDEPISFNLSNSSSQGAVVIGRSPFLGIDIEQISEDLDMLNEIATVFFSPLEHSQWHSLSRRDRASAFFRCWTRKEAYIKAVGCGFTVPPREIQVTLLPDQPAQLVRGCFGATHAWSIRDLSAPTGFAGAVVQKGTILNLRCGEWDQ